MGDLPALYGSMITKNRAVAYCSYHNAYLTVATLKGHKCLCKNCDALQKQEHEYWRQREIMKMKKKSRGEQYVGK